MSKSIQEIIINIGGKIDSTLGSSISSTTNKINSLGDTISKVAKVASVAFAAVKVKDFIGDTVNTFKDYQQAITQTSATAGIAVESEEFKKLDEAARAAGKATTKTAQESAEALGYMALAGWSVDDSIAGLMPVLRLSEATQADLATTSDLVTDSMSSLGLEVADLQKYLDTAVVANNKSNQTAQMLMEAYIGVGGTLNRLGTPLNESAALLGVLANRGIKGSEAGNSLNSVLINLTKKSGESYEAMKKLNIQAYDSEGKFKGISNVLKELNEKTSNLTNEQRDLYLQMIGGKTQLNTLNALMSGLNTLNEDSVNELDSLTKQLSDTDGALNTMADTINNTMSGAMAIFDSAVDDFKITLIKDIEPFITPIIRKIADKIPLISEKVGVVTSNVANSLEKVGQKFGAFRDLLGDSFSGFDVILDNSNQTAQMFMEAYSNAEKIFNKLNIPLNESSSLISVLANRDIKAGKAGNELNSILTNLAESSGKSYETMQELGIQVYDTEGNFKSIINVLKEVDEKTSTLSDKQKNDFLESIVGKSNADTFGALLDSLHTLNSEGTSELDRFNQHLLNTDGALNTMADTINKNKRISNVFGLDFSEIDNIKNKVNDIYKGIQDKIEKLSGFYDRIITPQISEIIDGISELIEHLQPCIKVVANILRGGAEFVMSTFGTMIEFVSNTFGSFLTVLNGVIEFLNGVFTLDFERAFDGIKKIAKGVFEFIAGIIEGISNAIIGFLNSIINTINSVINKIPILGDKLGDIPKINEVDFTFKADNAPVGPMPVGSAPLQIVGAASGGIATSPTLALIAEAGESEAVIPLSKLDSMLSNTQRENIYNIYNNTYSSIPFNALDNIPKGDIYNTYYNTTETPIEDIFQRDDPNLSFSEFIKELNKINVSDSEEKPINFLYNPTINVSGNANKEDIESALEVDKKKVQAMFNECMEYYQRRQRRISFSKAVF